MRKFISILLAGGLIFGAAATAGAKKAAPTSTILFTDATGDNGNDQVSPIPAADQAGFDLVNGSVMKMGTDLMFTVTQASTPPSGQPGEAFRLLWHFNVGTTEYRFTVKSLDVGKPDAVAQSGTERVGTVYQGVARLEQCSNDTTLPVTLSQCQVLKYYAAAFDTAKNSETWTVPLADLEATTGSLIGPGTGGATANGCHICWVAQYAERSLSPSTVLDDAIQTVTYKVPKK
jgi:hypothetical protein